MYIWVYSFPFLFSISNLSVLLLLVMIGNNSKLTRKKTLMFDGLRLCVPLWVLIISFVFAFAASTSICSVLQLWLTDPDLKIQLKNPEVSKDFFAHLVDQSTSAEVSCGEEKMVDYLTSEQKRVIKSLYKNLVPRILHAPQTFIC